MDGHCHCVRVACDKVEGCSKETASFLSRSDYLLTNIQIRNEETYTAAHDTVIVHSLLAKDRRFVHKLASEWRKQKDQRSSVWFATLQFFTLKLHNIGNRQNFPFWQQTLVRVFPEKRKKWGGGTFLQLERRNLHRCALALTGALIIGQFLSDWNTVNGGCRNR